MARKDIRWSATAPSSPQSSVTRYNSPPLACDGPQPPATAAEDTPLHVDSALPRGGDPHRWFPPPPTPPAQVNPFRHFRFTCGKGRSGRMACKCLSLEVPLPIARTTYAGEPFSAVSVHLRKREGGQYAIQGSIARGPPSIALDCGDDFRISSAPSGKAKRRQCPSGTSNGDGRSLCPGMVGTILAYRRHLPRGKSCGIVHPNIAINWPP